MALTNKRLYAYTALFLAVAIVRLYYCTWVPTQTGDVIRQMLTASLVLRDGLSSVGTPLRELTHHKVCFPDLPYNYPIMTLLWWVLSVSISPTLFFSKLLLTSLEAVNSWQVYKLTHKTWAALAYWAMPGSLWWVSVEGQYEPIQAFFTFAAVRFLFTRPYIAWALLGLAIQSKLSAIVLLPFFLWQFPKGVLILPFAFTPTLTANLYFPAIKQAYGWWHLISYVINPMYWAWWDKRYWAWVPDWLRFRMQVSTYSMFFMVAGWAIWKRRYIQSLSPLLFLTAVKSSSLGHGWYLVLFPSLASTIGASWIYIAALGLDPLAITKIIHPWWLNTQTKYYSGINAFTEIKP